MNIKQFLVIPAVLILASCGGEGEGTDSPESNEDTLSNTEVSEEEMEVEEEVFNTLVADNAAGDFKIGGAFEAPNSAYTIEKETVKMSGEGEEWEETIYKAKRDDIIMLHLKPAYDYETDTYSDTIGEMLILGPEYVTAEGAHVGMSITEFSEMYPDYKIWYTYVSDRYVIETEKYDLQFIIDPSGVLNPGTGSQEMEPMELAYFDPETIIQFIRIYK